MALNEMTKDEHQAFLGASALPGYDYPLSGELTLLRGEAGHLVPETATVVVGRNDEGEIQIDIVTEDQCCWQRQFLNPPKPMLASIEVGNLLIAACRDGGAVTEFVLEQLGFNRIN